MSDFFSTAIAMQQEIVRAQQAQLDAAQAAIDAAGERVAEMREAGQAAADANAKAWMAWANMWGWM